MIYIVSAGAALLTTVCLYLYLLKTGYFVMNGDAHASLAEENIVLPDTEDPDEEEDNKEVPEENDAEEGPQKEKKDKTEEEKTVKEELTGFYTRGQIMLILPIFFIITLVSNYLMYTYTVESSHPRPLFFAKMAIMCGITGAAALTDFKRRKIPNALIACGAVSRGIIYVLEFIFDRDEILFTLKNDLIGFLLGFVMLFVVAIISKGGIGYGDVKLFGVLGVMAGSTGLYMTLLISLIINSVTALGLMAAKKKTIKSTLPMAPFIYAAFVVVCILGLC